jgi:hypothetical protein
MIIKELIEKLQKLDSNLPVLVNGYEGGCNDIKDLTEIQVIRDVNLEWYYGAHEKVESLHKNVIEELAKDQKFPTLGVLIS